MEVWREQRGARGCVVKRATSPEELRRMAAERDALQRAAHPGVVQAVPGDDPGLLVTRDAGAGTVLDLADGRVLSADEVSGFGAVVATTLADLHDLGLVHGRVLGEHVVVGAGGQPVLCGLAAAGPADADGCRGDVVALAQLLLSILPPGSPRRLRRLLQGTAGGRRPGSARVLAAGLARSTPSPRLPTVDWTPAPQGPRPAGPPAGGVPWPGAAARPEGMAGAGGAGGRGGVGAPGAAAGSGDAGGPDEPGGPDAAGGPEEPAGPGAPAGLAPLPAGTETAARGVVARARAHRRPRATAVGAVALVGLIGVAGAVTLATSAAPPEARGAQARLAFRCPPGDEGCRPLLRDGLFRSRGGWWRVPPWVSVVVVGRFGCGEPLPAVLDRSTGQAWVFGAWPGGAGHTAAREVADQPGATQLRVQPGAEGCDRLALLVRGAWHAASGTPR